MGGEFGRGVQQAILQRVFWCGVRWCFASTLGVGPARNLQLVKVVLYWQ